MNKTKKNFVYTLIGICVLMMVASSVSAAEEETRIIDEEPNLIAPYPDIDESTNLISPNPESDNEPNLISPEPDNDLGPLIISPETATENEVTSLAGNDFPNVFILVGAIVVIAALTIIFIIVRKKN